MRIRKEKAAIVIQENFRVYKEWLVTEKWSIMIKMEKKARGQKEKDAMMVRQKKQLRQAVRAPSRCLRVVPRYSRTTTCAPREN